MPARTLNKPRRGFITLPKGQQHPKYKIIITHDNVEYVIANSWDITQNDLIDASIQRASTTSLSSFDLTILNKDRKYLDLFDEDDIVDIYMTYESTFDANTQLRFRGYVNNANVTLNNGKSTIKIDGVDYPAFIEDETVIKQWVAANIFDTFIDRTSPTGTVDSEGNYESGVLYDTGLTLQFYDNVVAKDWVIPATLSSGDYTTLKSNFTTAITDSFTNKTHLNITKNLVDAASFDFYIHYDKSLDKWYLRLFPEKSITNNAESVAITQNYINGPTRFGYANNAVLHDVTVYGKTSSSMPIVRTAYDTIYTGSRRKKKAFTFSNLETIDEVDEKANYLLNLSKTRIKKADGLSAVGLITLKPGEMIPLNIPQVGLNQTSKIPQFTHKIANGGLLTTTFSIEKESIDLSRQLRNRINAEDGIKAYDNINDMDQCLFLDFRDGQEGTFFTLTNMRIVDKVLQLDDGQSSGNFETISAALLSFSRDILKAEIRIEGSNLTNTTYEIKVNSGDVYSNINVGEVSTFPTSGSDLFFKINAETISSVTPQINRLIVLLKLASS